MKRLLFSCTVLLMIGLYAGYFLPCEAVAVITATAFVAGLIKTIKSENSYIKICSAMLSLSLIVGTFLIPYCDVKNDIGLSEGEKKTLTLRVRETPKIHNDYCSYVCDILKNAENTRSSLGIIKLSYQNTETIFDFGDVFTATCKITKPQGAENRGGFDYSLYLKTKGIFNTGYILDKNVTIISKNNFSFSDNFKLLNITLCKKIDSSFSKKKATFLKAVLLGEKSDMTPTDYTELKKSGLSHIAAVSGMHLSYIVMLLSALSSAFKIRKRLFAIVIIPFSICFMFLTGMSPSVVRATIMTCCIFIGDLLIAPSDSLTSLGIAALIILIPNPFTAFSTSFILSFVSTAGILVLLEPLEKFITPKRILQNDNLLSKILCFLISTVSVSISAQLFSFLPSVFIFNEFSLWALPSNLLITPFLPIILAGGFLFCLVSICNIPLTFLFVKITTSAVYVAQSIISFFGKLDLGTLSFGKIDVFFIMGYVLFILTILLFLTKYKNYIIYPLIVLLITLGFGLYQFYSSTQKAYVSFINAGQGDSTLITLPGKVNILIDGGNPSEDDSDSMSNSICSYLINSGVKNIDFMIATHANSDHIGGLFDVLECFDVDNLLIPPSFESNELAKELIENARAKDVNIYTITTGSQFDFSSQIHLVALMPDEYTAEYALSENDTSLVLRLDCYGTSFLFMGDLEASGERYMLRLINDELIDADVLKVGHHGSKTSTTEAFLEKCTPQFAFIPVGKNSFGHPSDEVLKRLYQLSTTVFRADMNKDVIFVLTKDGISNIIYS